LGNLFSSFETPKEYLLSNGQSREGIGFSKASRRYTAMGPEKDKEICTALESQGLAMLSEQRGPAKESTIVQKITIIIFIKTSQMGLGAAGALLRLMDTYGPLTRLQNAGDIAAAGDLKRSQNPSTAATINEVKVR